MSRHARREHLYIDELIEQLDSDNYTDFERNVEYGTRVRTLGEIDLIAYLKDGRIDIFEVKATSRHIETARMQLERAKAHYKNVRKTYIYIGLEDKLIEHTIIKRDYV